MKVNIGGYVKYDTVTVTNKDDPSPVETLGLSANHLRLAAMHLSFAGEIGLASQVDDLITLVDRQIESVCN